MLFLKAKQLIEDVNYLYMMECECEKIEDEILEESGTSTIRVSKAKKRKALAGGNAMHLCKKLNPSLYKKYKKMKDATKKIKEQILKKYKSKGAAMAKKQLK